MKKLLLIALALFLSGVPGRSQRPEKYVVILSMDGFRWDMANNAHTPTLDSIRDVGSYAETYPCFPANTFPNHYSMATGLHPDRHGIVNNTFYDSGLDRTYMISDKQAVGDCVFWEGEPIWNTVERQGLLANIFMWVGSEAPVNGRYATVWTKFDSEVPFRQRADWVIEALHRPVEDIPNLIMWYFEEPDAVGHKYGPESPEAKATVERIDSVLNYFMSSVRTSPVFDKINFIFTSDHGMSTLSADRYVNLYPFLDHDRIKYSITGTPLYIEPEEEYTDKLLGVLQLIPRIKAYRKDDLPERFRYGTHNRIAGVVVVPQTGWTVDISQDDRPKVGGGHGFDPFDRDMHMVFYGMGPGFKAGYEHKPFQNLHIYALVCELLGVAPAPGDWDLEQIRGMLNKEKCR